MTDENDFLRVIDDDDTPPNEAPLPAWKVAIIDDDQAVHEGTRFALFDYNLNGQGVELLSAYSAEEGRELLAAIPNPPV